MIYNPTVVYLKYIEYERFPIRKNNIRFLAHLELFSKQF